MHQVIHLLYVTTLGIKTIVLSVVGVITGKLPKVVLLPQPVSPILVFYLNSGTPPYHNLLESTVESLASWSLSLRLKLIARLFDCFVQLSLSRVVFLVPFEYENFA